MCKYFFFRSKFYHFTLHSHSNSLITNSHKQKCYADYRTMRAMYHGFINYRQCHDRFKQNRTSPFTIELANYRAKFLKFLFALWCASIFGLDPDEARCITNVQRGSYSITKLYHATVLHFSMCIHRHVFGGCLGGLHFVEIDRTAEVPSIAG